MAEHPTCSLDGLEKALDAARAAVFRDLAKDVDVDELFSALAAARRVHKWMVQAALKRGLHPGDLSEFDRWALAAPDKPKGT